MKKYGYYTSEIVDMIREKVEKHRADLIDKLDVNSLLNGSNFSALKFSELKGAISMADEIIEELEKETGGEET